MFTMIVASWNSANCDLSEPKPGSDTSWALKRIALSDCISVNTMAVKTFKNNTLQKKLTIELTQHLLEFFRRNTFLTRSV